MAIYYIYNTVLFLSVSILGPRVSGVHGEPWVFPPIYVNFDANFAHRLRGFWGQWWHRLFRLHLTSICYGIASALKLPWTSRGAAGVRVVIAFALSGVLHTCGSYTLYGHIVPWASSLFAPQALGIGIGLLIASRLQSMFPHQTTHVCMKRLMNLTTAFGWLCSTFLLLADDFARGRLWLFKPLPFSVLRGLGIGSEERLWKCWRGPWFYWYRGKTLRGTGIAI